MQWKAKYFVNEKRAGDIIAARGNEIRSYGKQYRVSALGVTTEVDEKEGEMSPRLYRESHRL